MVTNCNWVTFRFLVSINFIISELSLEGKESYYKQYSKIHQRHLSLRGFLKSFSGKKYTPTSFFFYLQCVYLWGPCSRNGLTFDIYDHSITWSSYVYVAVKMKLICVNEIFQFFSCFLFICVFLDVTHILLFWKLANLAETWYSYMNAT